MWWGVGEGSLVVCARFESLLRPPQQRFDVPLLSEQGKLGDAASPAAELAGVEPGSGSSPAFCNASGGWWGNKGFRPQ